MTLKRWLGDLNSQWSVLNSQLSVSISIACWLIWCALSRFHWTISEVAVFTPLLLQHSVILILGTSRLTWLDFTSSGQMYVHIPFLFFFVTTFCSFNHYYWGGCFFMIWNLMTLENANHTKYHYFPPLWLSFNVCLKYVILNDKSLTGSRFQHSRVLSLVFWIFFFLV